MRGYSAERRITLPTAYIRHYIPLDRSHILTNETAKCWPHLAGIVNELPVLKDSEVGLLIGYDCAQALAPRQVITGEVHEPYAQRTDFGCSIVGRTRPPFDLDDATGCSHRIATQELTALTPSDAINMLGSGFADSRHDDKRTSQDDLQFLQKLERGTRQDEDGYNEMPLPFKSCPHLPDDKRLAMIRLGHLKKKLNRNETLEGRGTFPPRRLQQSEARQDSRRVRLFSPLWMHLSQRTPSGWTRPHQRACSTSSFSPANGGSDVRHPEDVSSISRQSTKSRLLAFPLVGGWRYHSRSCAVPDESAHFRCHFFAGLSELRFATSC